MGCKACQNGRHGDCVRRNKNKTTGCPGNCQHRGTKHERKVSTGGARY